jgi:hypothetical protein
MANSKKTKEVITVEQLTNDELSKVKIGTCPKCGEALNLHVQIEVDPNDFVMTYNAWEEKWELRKGEELNYIYQGLQCQKLECSAEFDVIIVQPDESQ